MVAMMRPVGHGKRTWLMGTGVPVLTAGNITEVAVQQSSAAR